MPGCRTLSDRRAFRKGLRFETKPEIALEQIRQALEQQVPVGVVLADAGYGKGTQFRTELTQLGLQYAVGIESNATVWEPGQRPLPAPRENRDEARLPSACSGVQTINPFR